MGIYDRDYVRVGPRSSSGLGSVRMVSVNTWLIVINVAIFLLNNVVLSQPRPVSYGNEFAANVPAQVQREGVVVRDQGPFRHPEQRHLAYYPIVDRANPSQEIGRARVAFMPVLESWGHFSTGRAVAHLELWRFVTFQFLHANTVHLAFNMLGLWFVGGLVEAYLGRKRYLAFYLVCGMFGAVLYLFLNLAGYGLGPAARLPFVLFHDAYTPLVGASAGIFGVLMAAAFIAPDSIVDVMGVIPMRLRTAVYLFTGLSLFNLMIGSRNAGGEAAHIGGAIAGYYFIRHTHLLRDFFDIFGDSRRVPRRAARDAAPSGEVERILDKIRAQGLHSLTDAERRVLRRASEEQQRRSG